MIKVTCIRLNRRALSCSVASSSRHLMAKIQAANSNNAVHENVLNPNPRINHS